MHKSTFALLLLGLTACASSVPKALEQAADESAKASRRVEAEAAAAQASIQEVGEAVHRQLAGMRYDIQLARQKSEMAVEAVQEQAKHKVKSIVREKVVPVADPVFSAQDRDDLLSRASSQMKKLEDATGQLRALAAQMQRMREEVSRLQEFSESPRDFVATHGISGILLLLVSVVSYLTGKKRKR